jgi:hypothetical protein
MIWISCMTGRQRDRHLKPQAAQEKMGFIREVGAIAVTDAATAFRRPVGLRMAVRHSKAAASRAALQIRAVVRAGHLECGRAVRHERSYRFPLAIALMRVYPKTSRTPAAPRKRQPPFIQPFAPARLCASIHLCLRSCLPPRIPLSSKGNSQAMHRLSFISPRQAVLAAALLFSAVGTLTAAPNTLTPQEQASGWRLLFDGRSTAGWHTYGKKSVTAGSWQIQDGCLVIPKGNGRPNGTGGDLVTNTLFTNFEFQFEWRVGPGGNSGVEYLFTEGEKRTANFYPGDTGDSPVGFEYQVLDDAPHAKNAANRLSASIYSLVTATGKTLRPVGEFNEGRIVVDGHHVEHWLNGVKVAECELSSAALEHIIATSKYQHYTGVGVKRATPIALQDHGAEVAYRNLKLRELRPTAAARTSTPPVAATSTPPPVAAPQATASAVSMQAADWRVWCWSKKDNRWIEHPLDKMTVQIQGGVLTARNTTDSHWARAILLYHRSLLDGDFIVSADFRGQLESFDLQAADGTNSRLSCLKVPQDQQWHNLLLSRWQGKQTAWVGDAPAALQTDKAPAGMKGYFCFKLRPGETVEIRNVKVQQGR